MSRGRLVSGLCVIAALIIAAAVALMNQHQVSAAGRIVTIYPKNTTPSVVSTEDDTRPVELGVVFKVNTPGSVLGVSFYKGKANVGKHTGTLWTTSGQKLASATFTSETASGWQSVRFAKPIKLTPGQKYVASYHAAAGRYAQRENTFDQGHTIGNADITGLAGTFGYGSGSFPAQIWRNSEYYVDVTFQTTDTSAPPSSSAPTTSKASAAPSASKTKSASPTASHTTTKPTSSAPSTTTKPTSSAPSTTSKPTSSAPTTSAPPTASTGCIAKPSACGFPDATNTGPAAGTSLKASGSITISTDGQVVSGLNITGCVTIKANNVTFKDSVVHGNGCRAVVYSVNGSKNVSIQRVEIDGTNSNTDGGPDPGLYGWGFNATGLNIHNTGDAVDIESGDTLSNSYIHDLRVQNGSHTDGVQATDGSSMVISHNTILAIGKDVNEGIILGADLGNIDGVQVTNNIIDGGNNAVVAGNSPGYSATNISFTNNRFGKVAQYGVCNFNQKMTFTGNVWDATGAPVSCSS